MNSLLNREIHFGLSTINRLIGFDCMKNQTATFYSGGKSIGKLALLLIQIYDGVASESDPEIKKRRRPTNASS